MSQSPEQSEGGGISNAERNELYATKKRESKIMSGAGQKIVTTHGGSRTTRVALQLLPKRDGKCIFSCNISVGGVRKCR